mmetsp:Transcript_44752/g.85576  ORF Transcript_44752/g.85576 Transcript_44752/m.85576 type:complete len:210 (-) Transcript_44752:25-654(-)
MSLLYIPMRPGSLGALRINSSSGSVKMAPKSRKPLSIAPANAIRAKYSFSSLLWQHEMLYSAVARSSSLMRAGLLVNCFTPVPGSVSARSNSARAASYLPSLYVDRPRRMDSRASSGNPFSSSPASTATPLRCWDHLWVRRAHRLKKTAERALGPFPTAVTGVGARAKEADLSSAFEFSAYGAAERQSIIVNNVHGWGQPRATWPGQVS